MKAYLTLAIILPTLASAPRFPGDEICQHLNELQSLSGAETQALNDYIKSEAQRTTNRVGELLEEPEFAEIARSISGGGLYYRIGQCYLYGVDVPKDREIAKLYMELAVKEGGSEQAAHILASLRLFHSNDWTEQRQGFLHMQREFEDGSAFAAGNLGSAYLLGLGVEPDQDMALEMYEHAAHNGMTYWQFLLAHAHEMGYFGFEPSEELKEFYLQMEPKVHYGRYECWVAQYYRNGTFPENPDLLALYRARCEKANNSLETGAERSGTAQLGP